MTIDFKNPPFIAENIFFYTDGVLVLCLQGWDQAHVGGSH